MLKGKTADKIITIDGKTICSTGKLSNNGNALHIASAIISDYGLVIGSKECNGKFGEVEAFCELIELLDIKDTLIVADALHCKKQSAEKVIDEGGDYLFVVKDNNPHLLENIELFSHNKKDDEHITEEKNGGRIEKRTAYVVNDLENFCHKDEWKTLPVLVQFTVKLKKRV